MNAVVRRLMLGVAATALVATAMPAPAVLAGPELGVEGGGFGRARLERFAQLPARSFVPGSEPSGAALGTAPINGVPVPFDDQPVQGFSGVLRNSDGTF